MIRQRQLPASNGIAEFDPFATPEPMTQAADESPAQLFHKIHRLLRGRYVLALVLSALGAVGGAVGGYLSSGQKWQSIGAIRVEPMGKYVVAPTPETGPLPFFDSYVRDQVGFLEEPKTIDRAMLSDEWRKFSRGLDKQAKRDFRKALTVDVDRENRQWIRVRFVDRDPAAAQVAVQQVMDSYRVLFGPQINLSSDDTIRALQAEKLKYRGEIQTLENKIADLGKPYGTSDLTVIHTETLRQLNAASADLAAQDLQISQMKAAQRAQPVKPDQAAVAPKPPADVNAEEAPYIIMRVDAIMERLVEQREVARNTLLRLQVKYPPTSKQVQEAVDNVDAFDRQITDRRDQWLKAHNNTLPQGDGPGQILVTVDALPVLEAKRNDLQDYVNKKLTEANKINETRQAIDSIQKEIGQKREELAIRESRLSLLNSNNTNQPAESNVIGRVNIVSTGDESSLYSDGRKKLAALGFLLGGSLPIFGVMLIGALDRRYRYSDDAGSTGSQIPLLGILPYIPEAINDPEKASVAAHCVHQIRTLLQIGGVEHDRKVFAITSATSGDGKTSLSLSLGLSFAASGSNTLLIDFDMIGGGLTAAMGARSDVGLLAAIDDGQLEGHVRPTAFPRLSIIPAGRDDAQEISRLSPKQVRRIIEQARKEFDVIVIDTGPILGSIEATLVCGVADGVVLALGRGQQRSMATRAIQTLRGVGAHIMGVVFNRAQPNDFKRAVSQSVRSVPSQSSGSPSTLKALPAIGPMARTVASHIRPDA